MTKKKTNEEFKQEVFEKVGVEYTPLTEYNGATKYVSMRHICLDCNNHEWDVLPSNFLSKGTRCPICSDPSSIQNRQTKQDKFVKEVYDLVGEEYIVLGFYETSNTPILMRHNCDKCHNHEYPVRCADFLNGGRCPECFGTHQKTTDEFKQEVFNLVGTEYKVIGEYINNYTDIMMKHNYHCQHIFPVNPNNFLRGSRCPKCNETSKGEIKEKETLIKFGWIEISQKEFNKLNDQDKYNENYFIPQKRFKGLVGINNGLLSYDLYLPKFRLLIEHQGIQHEKYIKHFHKTIVKFEKQVEHDRRKKEYAESNNYNFLEIWYYDFDNIEQILESKLQELSTQQQDSSILIAK